MTSGWDYLTFGAFSKQLPRGMTLSSSPGAVLAAIESNDRFVTTVTVGGDDPGEQSADSLSRLEAGLRRNTHVKKVVFNGSDALDLVLRVLETNTTVKNLVISDGPSERSSGALAKVLRSNSTLRSLDFHPSINQPGFSVASALTANSSLTNVCIPGIVSDAEALHLASVLNGRNSIRQLEIRLPFHTVRLGAGAQRTLALSLANCKTLTTLSARFVELDSENVRTICASKTVTDLTLSPIERFDGAAALFALLASNVALTRLDVRGNKLENFHARHLADVLLKNSALKSLNLARNRLSDLGIASLSTALETNCTLVSLDLGENSVTKDGAGIIATALAKNVSLTDLSLFKNNIVWLDGAKALAELFSTNSVLTKINLACNMLGDDGAFALARVLEKNSSLTIVDLSSCGIQVDGAVALAIALAKNTSICTFLFCNNNLYYEGAEAFAFTLATNVSLTALDLALGGIRDEGAFAIGSALASNICLTRLDLSKNEIRDALPSLVWAASATLTDLNLEANLSEFNSRSLVDALERNTHLMKLKWSSAPPSHIKRVAELLERNARLQLESVERCRLLVFCWQQLYIVGASARGLGSVPREIMLHILIFLRPELVKFASEMMKQVESVIAIEDSHRSEQGMLLSEDPTSNSSRSRPTITAKRRKPSNDAGPQDRSACCQPMEKRSRRKS